MENESTYQAMQAVAPGRLERVRKFVRDPGPGEVRMRVEGLRRMPFGCSYRGGCAANRLAARAGP